MEELEGYVMNNKTNIIPFGTIFIITDGDWSDYTIHVLCKALKKINILDIQREYLAKYPKQKEDYEFNISQFIAWLVNDMHYAEEIDFEELWLGPGDYRDFELK